jgi:nucleoid-associated protein YgaU
MDENSRDEQNELRRRQQAVKASKESTGQGGFASQKAQAAREARQAKMANKPTLSSSSPAPTAPATPTPPVQPDYIAQHTVAPGETLSHIATKYYNSAARDKWMAIYEANKETIGDNPSLIRVGQRLNIPQLGS